MNIYLDIVDGVFIYNMNTHVQTHIQCVCVLRGELFLCFSFQSAWFLEHGMYFVGPHHISGFYGNS